MHRKLKTLSFWDWNILIAVWRYYEHRNTIAPAMKETDND